MGSSIRRFCACCGVVALLFAAASPAAASPETLKRSVGNILFAPLDIVFSPFVAARSIYRNLHDIDDSIGVRVAYTVPGFGWNTGLQIGAGAIREIAGMLEFLPGLVLLPFERDMDPLFTPSDRADALVNIETRVLNVKFGVDYTSLPY